MKIYLYLCAAILLTAAGWSVRGWRDDSASAEALAKVQTVADRQRKLDEASQARLAKQITDLETAYDKQARSIPALPILNPKFEVLAACISAPAFSDEFVRMWNSDPGDAADAE
jgi:hypothetical protein